MSITLPPPPRPGPLGLIQYAGVDMQEYAAAVSSAKDAEIERLRAGANGLRTELLVLLADNAALRAEVAGLRAEVAWLRAFVEYVRRNGSTHLANMAVAVLAARKGEA